MEELNDGPEAVRRASSRYQGPAVRCWLWMNAQNAMPCVPHRVEAQPLSRLMVWSGEGALNWRCFPIHLCSHRVEQGSVGVALVGLWRQQDWFLSCLKGGRGHPLAALLLLANRRTCTDVSPDGSFTWSPSPSNANASFVTMGAGGGLGGTTGITGGAGGGTVGGLGTWMHHNETSVKTCCLHGPRLLVPAGLCQCRGRIGYIGLYRALIAKFAPASADLSSASTGKTRQHNCFSSALIWPRYELKPPVVEIERGGERRAHHAARWVPAGLSGRVLAPRHAAKQLRGCSAARSCRWGEKITTRHTSVGRAHALPLSSRRY